MPKKTRAEVPAAKEVAIHDAMVTHARGYIRNMLQKLNFSEEQVLAFTTASRRTTDEKWRTMLPPHARDRSAVVAARSILEDINAWEQAWTKRRWGTAVKFAYCIGRSVQLLQMVDFSTSEKQKAKNTQSAHSHSRNAAANREADRIEAQQRAANSPKLSVKQLHDRIKLAGHDLSEKNFYRVRQKWKTKENSPEPAQEN